MKSGDKTGLWARKQRKQQQRGSWNQLAKLEEGEDGAWEPEGCRGMLLMIWRAFSLCLVMSSLARVSLRQPSGFSAKRFAGPSLDLAQLPVREGLVPKMRTERSAGGWTASLHKQKLQRKSFKFFQIFIHRHHYQPLEMLLKGTTTWDVWTCFS